MASNNEWPQFRKDIRYTNSSKRNNLQTCIPRPTSASDKDRLWVVYVHGGAWHFPGQSAADFDKAQELLLKSPVLESIAGFASIDYRLSPCPDNKKDPSDPSDPARNAHHPDHINDVLSAIEHLQQTYQFGDRFVLVGHSCGATLVLQAAMSRNWGSQSGSEKKVIPPVAILGVEGIYDIPAMVKYHDDEPFYRTFVERAFGKEEELWKAVSPTNSNLKETWSNGRLVAIAHSVRDELVEFEQAEFMVQSLKAQGFSETQKPEVKLIKLDCLHEEVWEKGIEVARTIEITVNALKST